MEDKVYELAVDRGGNLYKIVEQYEVLGKDVKCYMEKFVNVGEDAYSFSPSKFHF